MRLFVLLLMGCVASTAVLDGQVRVLVWSERSEPVEVYPAGINGAIAEMLAPQRGVRPAVANLLDPEQGLSEEVLSQTDVLIWFGHRNHADVSDESVQRVVSHIRERGMGFLPLHSAHYCRVFQELMRIKAAETGRALDEPVGEWGHVRDSGAAEAIHVLQPGHPIAKGVADFVIPKTELYANPFRVPPPDEKILEGSWEGGEQHGSDGLAWTVGRGKIFYFRPGHETYPIYRQPEVQQILRNAVLWLAKPGS